MHNLIEYGDNYFKISESLWQYHRDELYLDANVAIAYFPVYNNRSAFFKL